MERNSGARTSARQVSTNTPRAAGVDTTYTCLELGLAAAGHARHLVAWFGAARVELGVSSPDVQWHEPPLAVPVVCLGLPACFGPCNQLIT